VRPIDALYDLQEHPGWALMVAWIRQEQANILRQLLGCRDTHLAKLQAQWAALDAVLNRPERMMEEMRAAEPAREPTGGESA